MLEPSIIQVMILKMMRWAGHVAGLWWITLKERDILEELGAERRIILTCILKKQDGKTWNGLSVSNKDKRRVLLSSVIRFLVLYNVRNSVTSWDTISF